MEVKNTVGKPKGLPKTGGRKAGTPNAITGSLRSKIDTLINDNWERVQEDLDNLEPAQRLTFLEKLLNYALPRLASTTAEIDVKQKLSTLSDVQLDALIDEVIKNNTYED